MEIKELKTETKEEKELLKKALEEEYLKNITINGIIQAQIKKR